MSSAETSPPPQTQHHLLKLSPFPPLHLFDPSKTIAHGLAANPTWSPKKLARKYFPKPWFSERLYRRTVIKHDLRKGRIWSAEELDEAAARGSFPYRPSDLFLQMYADVLTCLARNPLAGNVSPALIGTSGTIPLSIVSTIPDIMKHYYDCIVLAEKEVFLVTNYWQPSNSVEAVSGALRELSNRIGDRKGQKVVVKIMWDRGAWEQLVRNHARVSEETWTGLKLPAKSEVPNLLLDVINFHRPLLGTFHQKALVVDRKIALLNSNNIQDRPNIEMMVHLEGPVVDSIYDVLLLSWHEYFDPPLPCATLPSLYTQTPFPYTFAEDNPFLAEIDVAKAAKAARKLLTLQNRQQHEVDDEFEQTRRYWWRRGSGETHSPRGEAENGDGKKTPQTSAPSGAFANLVSQLVEKAREEKARMSNGSNHVEKQELGMKVLATPPPLREGSDATVGGSSLSVAATRERGLSSASKSSGRLAALSTALNAGANSKLEATIDDETQVHDFAPHLLHKTHTPFPIAMVNRGPHGMPGHQDIRVPQNAAWLAGFRHAREKVFIQTPTLNAAPVVRAVLEACKTGGPNRTGIQVTLFLDLGFNDKGESVPFQGGTNEEVVFRLYTDLCKVRKEQNLHVFWYTGKDQSKPVNAVHKTRNCHVKFMSIDGQCAIVGNGNQDTQSWFHSQECNILVDSKEVVEAWLEQLRTNQSTYTYGRVDTDGIWRDPKTKEPLQAPKSVSCFSAIAAML